MPSAIYAVFTLAFVIVFVSLDIGRKEVEEGSKKLGIGIAVGGLLVGSGTLLVFGQIVKASEPVILGAKEWVQPQAFLRLQSAEPAVLHAPVGCVVYFRADNNSVRPVKSTGEGIQFQKGEKVAVISGKKCEGTIKVLNSAAPAFEKIKGGGLLVKI